MKVLQTAALFLALGFSNSLFAKPLQIIHTNDLHSYFQGTRGGIGGYAQLKKVIDELRADAKAKGIPSLYLDGGDFGEGSSFYFSNQGVDSLRALDMLGVDITVLGNHDFILGGKELRNQIRDAKLKAKILSANLKGKRWMGLSNLMPDYVDYNLDGLKVRIFGLTTNEIHYMYPIRPLGWIANPHKTGVKQANKAVKDGVDFLIGLTHIGLEHDIKLVENTRTLDLVVGGHSHIRLGKPELTKNLNGRLIPILQAGAHSGYVGSMILDIKGKGEAEILDYKMINIFKDMPQDEIMKEFVGTAYMNREQYFGRNWDEVIGFSDITLSGNFNGQDSQTRTCWSRHIARLTREAAKTELGLQFDVFQGEQIPAGPITYGDIVDNFPHFRRWGDQGWNVARARISGFVLKQILNALARSEVALQVMIDGIKAQDKAGHEVPYDPTVHTAESAMINGEQIRNLRYYSIALPSEVPYGMEKLLNIFGRVILHQLDYLETKNYWPLLEEYIQKNSPIRCLKD
ncbi:bifunctional metallophosphatase/5'-nucleotidase [Peredibacter sp. HCB2-198]|uniref:bifunctional metallophosphatase/5'-nucleotidase n=1 Tax=Peredibacter sp. HCB2-198 TaxID=3383025 RepID=UPI0038B5F3E0